MFLAVGYFLLCLGLGNGIFYQPYSSTSKFTVWLAIEVNKGFELLEIVKVAGYATVGSTAARLNM